MENEHPPLVLTILDTSGIQPYIFGTNNLRQSVGASDLVRWATEDAARDALLEICGADGVNVDRDGRVQGRYLAFPPDGQSRTTGLQAEWINSGGGNTLILFRNIELARRFTRFHSRMLLTEAPGVILAVAHEKMTENDALTEKIDVVIKRVNRKKQDRCWTAQMLGLGVTASCQYSGLPATVEYRDDPESNDLTRISTEVAKKLDRSTTAQKHLADLLSVELDDKYTLLTEFDQLGVKGEASYMGVVHIDGNGMGKRVKQLANDYATPNQNRAYIDAIQAFSESIAKTSEFALRQTVLTLCSEIERMEADPGERNNLRHKGGKTILPFRPIVYGGDDITFVCDGRHALSLAQRFMRLLESKKLKDKDYLYVRGGIAIVKSHYPFARAYEMAEELAESAKGYVKEVSGEQIADDLLYAPLSAMDWHLATTGLVLELGQIRRREYTRDPKKSGDLVMRPVLIRGYDGVDEWRRWSNFVDLVDQFSHRPWVGKRNKIKALREVLRQGSDKTKLFIQALGDEHRLAEIDRPGDFNSTGWVDGRCAWSDAIEALDLFVELKVEETVEEKVSDGGGE